MTKNISTILMICAVAVVILILAAGVYFLRASGISAVVGLPMLSIGAVIILVILLCSMAVVFASHDLQDKTQALALPEGSIRAVIALMLIVLFAILSIYLYGSLATTNLVSLGKVDAAVRDTLISTYGAPNIVSAASGDGRTFNVWFRQAASQDGVDFAKQLMVLVGTLVTSIASFYFGSKTATHATDRTSPITTAPVIEKITPQAYTRGAGAQDFSLQGMALDRITGVKLSLNGKQVAATAVKASADQVRFKIDVPMSQDAGVWAVTLIDSKLGEQASSQFLTIS
ncbi:hypothetical protein ACQZ44_00650 [Agrobacterium vitis]